MSYGYLGKIIRINLSTNSIDIEIHKKEFYRKYLGGKGFISYYLLRELPANVDPLGEENKLIFATGVLTGVPVAAMPRFAVGAKSPLTGGYGQAEAGGFWGPELKKAGYDGIIIEGKASKPVYIYIHNDKIEIKEATHLWGKNTGEVQDVIRQELNDNRIRVAQIGQAGENLVRYACIINDLKHANGRNGLGAVMGSKNLKAIAVRGDNKIPVADPTKVKEIGKRYLDQFMDNPLSRSLYEYGTSGGVSSLNASGILPTKNFVYGEFEGADRISGETLAKTIFKKREGCYACAIKCKRAVEINNDRFTVESRYGGPEYETVASFGSLCQVDNLDIISKANELCNKYTLDTISTGMAIAFTMECYEKGILTVKDLDGINAYYGNGEAVLQLIEKIVNREGIGNILAEGTLRAAQSIGNEADKCTLTVKGQELAMHDPRGKAGVGIGYAISETGADHVVIPHDSLLSQKGFTLEEAASLGIYEPLDTRDLTWKKVRMFMYLQQWVSFQDMAGICFFGPAPRGAMPIVDVVELLKAVTGWNITLWEVMKAGERAINMSRIYNLQEGFTKKDDILPQRFFEELENGSLKGSSILKQDFKTAIDTYYEMMGWNTEGVPTNGKLLELDLEEFCTIKER